MILKTNRLNKRVTPLSDFSLKSGSLVVREKNIQSGNFDAINVYYESLNKININQNEADFSCDAIKLARFIIKCLGSKKRRLTKDGSLPDSFYVKCADSFKEHGIINQNKNIILITMKQMMHLLRFAGIAKIENGCTFAADYDINDRALYCKILNAFWNGVNWADIFPSAPNAAIELHKDKMILIDILFHYNSRVEITALANDFFELTGFASKNDIHAISFIDFYLLFWLKNFHIINYYDANNKIFVNLTSTGKKLLALINN